MLKKLNYKVLVLTLMLSITLIIGMSSNIYAGGPNPEDPTVGGESYLEGPALIGTLTLSLVDDWLWGSMLEYNFEGKCRGKAVLISGSMPAFEAGISTQEDFDVIDSANLRNFVLTSEGPAGCHTDAGGEDIMVVNANKLAHAAGVSVITTEAVILSLIPVQ